MIKFLKNIFHFSRRFLAKIWLFLNLKITVIGVTGSYGKTNTSRAIAQVLQEKYQTLQTDLNLDTNYNLPITILKIKPFHQKLVLEYGVDHQGEMDFHLSLIKPQIVVLTGINPTHTDQEHLGSLQNLIKEKRKLLQALPKSGLAIINGNDPQARLMSQGTKAKTLFYGTNPKDDFWAKEIKVGFKGTNFLLVYQQGKEKKEIKIITGLIGRHFIQACLAAVGVGLNQGLTIEQIQKALAKTKPLPGRLSIEKGPQKTILLNDSLRANPASTLAGLQTLADLPTKGRRIAVLGEMGELGDSAEKEHRLIGEKAVELKIDFLLGIGPLQRLAIEQAIKSGMSKEKTFWAKDVVQAAAFLKKILKPNDLFYLKGSRLRHLERILLLLDKKEVGCRVVSCHFYHHCRDCPFLKTGI